MISSRSTRAQIFLLWSTLSAENLSTQQIAFAKKRREGNVKCPSTREDRHEFYLLTFVIGCRLSTANKDYDNDDDDDDDDDDKLTACLLRPLFLCKCSAVRTRTLDTLWIV